MHRVTCQICKEKFDRDKIPTVKYGNNRYAHLACFPEGELIESEQKVDPDYIELENYLKELFGLKKLTKKLKTQINEFTDKESYGYTYSGILKTLKWWYEIKKSDIAKAHTTISIVPYIYNDASNYYYRLFLIEEASKKSIRKESLNAKTRYVYLKELYRDSSTNVKKEFNFWDEEKEEK